MPSVNVKVFLLSFVHASLAVVCSPPTMTIIFPPIAVSTIVTHLSPPQLVRERESRSVGRMIEARVGELLTN